jgi:hypothetical protein
MANRLTGSTASPRRRASSPWRLVMLLCLGFLLLVVVGVGGLAYWGYGKVPAEPPGLEGVWRDPTDPKHSYRFRPGGGVDAWYEGLPMDHFLEWQRDGRRITVRTTRHWDFVGQLNGDEIRGKMILRDRTGAAESEHDAVWRRE